MRITPSIRSALATPRTLAGAAVLALLSSACGGDGNASRGTMEETASRGSTGPVEVGAIRASLGGEDRVWLPLYMERPEGPEASSVYSSRTIARRTAHSLSLGGNVAASPAPDGSLRLLINAMEPFDTCPCTFENQGIEYVVDLPNDLYEANDAVITVEGFRSIGQGRYEAEGSFRGTLVRRNDPSDRLPVDGVFDIDLILEVGTGR